MGCEPVLRTPFNPQQTRKAEIGNMLLDCPCFSIKHTKMNYEVYCVSIHQTRDNMRQSLLLLFCIQYQVPTAEAWTQQVFSKTVIYMDIWMYGCVDGRMFKIRAVTLGK